MDKKQQPFDIFISHSSKDSLTASAIKQSLQNRGIRCWKAPDDILPGESWPSAIMRALSRCRAMILVWTENSMTSMEVSKELTLAMRNNLIVVPFRIDNIEPSGDWEYHLANTHWMDASDGLAEKNYDLLGDFLLKALPAREPLTAPEENPMSLKDLEQLIEQALEDGVLTEQERTLLLRDAVALGRNRDEFNAELDARLVVRKKDMAARVPDVRTSAAPPAPPTPISVPVYAPSAHSMPKQTVPTSVSHPPLPKLVAANRSRVKLFLFGLLWSVAFIFGGLLLGGIISIFSVNLGGIVMFLSIFLPVLATRMTIKGKLPGTQMPSS